MRIIFQANIQQNIQMIKFFIIHKLIINEQIHRYQNHRIMDKPKPGRKRSHNLRFTDPQPKFFFIIKCSISFKLYNCTEIKSNLLIVSMYYTDFFYHYGYD